jgi:cyclic pyranopterin phosphate synthase
MSSPDVDSPTPVAIRRGPAPEMPRTGPLVDGFGRVHTDLRVSVTDRCNLRCVYCMPEEGVAFGARDEILTYEELLRVVRVARALGVRSVRLTGGEPLVRRGIVDFVRGLARLGLDDIAMTTNAMDLARLAAPLADAGLTRVNVSCDSLRADRFAEIRRRGNLDTVLAAMDAADRAGLGPVKVNVVLMAGINDDEVLDFAAFARSTGRVVRFIEFMPLDGDHSWAPTSVVASSEVVERIDRVWPLERVAGAHEVAPAVRYRFRDGRGEIGVIATVTQPFCGTCDRLRLTADGHVRNCLFAQRETPLRDVMRGGCDDSTIEMALRRSVWEKKAGRGSDDLHLLRPRRSMSMIGG